MRKTIYLKFILAYALFAFFGFVTVATFVSRLTYEYCQRQTSRNMYREATRIADTYAADLYNSEISLETVQEQMESLSYFMDTEIWIINPSGRMVVNSADAPDPEQEIIVEGFDPTITQKNYYTRGTFFDSFDEEKLSVIAPIINNYKTRGYVIIHKSASLIDEEVKKIIDKCYVQAREIIEKNRHVLEASAQLLLTKEKITREEFEALFVSPAQVVSEEPEQIRDTEEPGENA